MEEQPEPAAAEADTNAPVGGHAPGDPAPATTEVAAAEMVAVETEAAGAEKEDDAEEPAPTADAVVTAKFLHCRPPAAKAAWDALKAAEAAAAPEQGKVDALEVAKIAHQLRKVGVETALAKVLDVERAIAEGDERENDALGTQIEAMAAEANPELEADLKVRCRERPQVYHSHSV